MKQRIEEYYTNDANAALFEDYEPGTYGSADTVFTTIDTDPGYLKYTNIQSILTSKINAVVLERNRNEIDKATAEKRLLILSPKLDTALKRKENAKASFHKAMEGFSMKHSFTIKKIENGKVLHPEILVLFYDNLLIKDIVVINEGN